jgi:PIN domain nuclease of toxin-antitoxin system
VIHLDTHVVIWMFTGEGERLPPKVVKRIESDPIVVSPMVMIEIDLLREIGRITEGGQTMLDDLRVRAGLDVSSTPLASIVASAHSLTWTRDPFDRLIVANALADGATLLTRDRNIRKHCRSAAWG